MTDEEMIRECIRMSQVLNRGLGSDHGFCAWEQDQPKNGWMVSLIIDEEVFHDGLARGDTLHDAIVALYGNMKSDGAGLISELKSLGWE